MGKLAELSLQYFTNSSSEKLREDWENLKLFNDHGPEMLAVLNNYGRGCAIDLSYSYLPEDTNSPEETLLNVNAKDFPKEYSESNLCLAA